MLEGGLTIEEVIDFCKCAGDAGVDVLNISRGNILTAATVYEVAPVDIPHASTWSLPHVSAGRPVC